MSDAPPRAESGPLAGWALIALCAIYLLAGLGGHDPWKNDDATHFGIVLSELEGRGWLLPQLAGSYRPELPPLYYWVAAPIARASEWLLPLPDAVRLTTGFFGALFFIALAGAGRILHGQNGASGALLVAVGSLGLLIPLHETQPASALLAAMAFGYWGLLKLPDAPARGGLMLGSAIGAAFLSAGGDGLLMLLPITLFTALAPRWHSPSSRQGFVFALVVAVPLIALWPALLAWRAPSAFDAWWAHELARLRPSGESPLADYAELLSWFAWPALPLAAWAVWSYRRRLTDTAIALPLSGTVIALCVLVFLRDARPIAALPMLAPLALLAAAGAGQLRRGAANAFDWFGMMTFTLVAFLVWLGGVAMVAGIPAQIQHNFEKLEPGFVAQFSPLAWGISLLLTAIWVSHIVRAPRSPWRAVTHWAAGVTLMWALIAALWFPWIDYGKSYRNLALDLKQDVPNGDCVAGRNIGDALRASLHYFAGVVTSAEGSASAQHCPLLLEQSSPESAIPSGWHVVWEGHRPGDRNERIRLYRRDTPN